jgi:hypothetical protein
MTRVIVKIGQSNTLGEGMTHETLPTYLIAPNPHAFIFTQASSYWGALSPSENTGTTNRPEAWGSVAQEAYRFGLENPNETILFVQIAKGSTGIVENPDALDWSPRSRGEMFDLAEATIARALAALEITTDGIDAVEILGGESDSFDYRLAHDFDRGLSDLVDAARGWIKPEGQVIVAQINDTLPYSHIVNDAIRSQAYTFDSSDFELQSDGLHYNANGHIAIGNGFADQWIF